MKVSKDRPEGLQTIRGVLGQHRIDGGDAIVELAGVNRPHGAVVGRCQIDFSALLLTDHR